MKKSTTGIYHSTLFHFPGIVHGFSTKPFGDMRDSKKRSKFLSALRIDESSLVWQEQVHRDYIRIVSDADCGRTLSGADGLIYKKASNDHQITLSVHTADCVPLLALDPMIRIIGSIHAGWKGTTLRIGKKLIHKMEELGAHASDIRVVIGPRIGICCYKITSDRAEVFRREFSGSDVVAEKDGDFFADIGKANYIDLLSVGVKPEHIDYDPSLCTYCITNDFYSFRRNGKPLDGELLGVISFKK